MRLLFMLALVISGPLAFSQTNQQVVGTDLGLTFKAAYLSQYLFRGKTLSPDDTYQGEFGVGIASWSYNLLHSSPTEDQNSLIEHEYNHTISFTTIGRGGITTLGYNLFDYDGDGLDTQELFVRYSRPSRWNPSYGIAYDIDAYKGYYMDFSLSRSFPFTRRSQFTFNGQLGLAFELKEEVDRTGFVRERGFYSKDGLVHASLQVNYLFQFTPKFNLEVGYAYHRANDEILYADPKISREEPVAHARFKLIVP